MINYSELYHKLPGDDLAKIKTILIDYSDRWDWAGHHSIVSDLLDDQNITASDVLEALKTAYDYEGGNHEFKKAILAIQAGLRKSKMQRMNSHHQSDKDINSDLLDE